MEAADKTPTLEDVAVRSGVSIATVSRYLNNPGVVKKTTGVRIQEAIAETGYLSSPPQGALEAIKVPTLEDVATKSGVSTATVSRFLNNPGVVKAATGERIQEAIRETGYIPNLLAGGLASNRSRLVAVLIPHLSESLFNDTIERMLGEIVSDGTNVMLGLTGMDVVRTEQIIRAAISRRVDAIISTGPVNPAITHLVRRSGTVFLQIWELPEHPVDIAIGFSHSDVGRDLAKFVRGRGYMRPHIITSEGKRAWMRRDGFITEWVGSGGAAPTEASVDIPSSFGHARGAFARIRRLNPMPDVIVCGSDYLAQGIIIEAQAAGLRVPEDMAVVGFGNSSLAGEMRPTITTVDIDGTRIAREAIAAIRSRADRTQVTRIVDVGYRLIARESA